MINFYIKPDPFIDGYFQKYIFTFPYSIQDIKYYLINNKAIVSVVNGRFDTSIIKYKLKNIDIVKIRKFIIIYQTNKNKGIQYLKENFEYQKE